MNTMMKKLVGCVSVIMSLVLASQAGQYWWSGNGSTLGGSGTWDTSANKWRDGSEVGAFTNWPNSGGDEAVFTNASGTATLSGAINVNKLTFYVNSCTISGSTLNLTGSSPTFTKRSTGNNTWEAIDCPLRGSSDLTLVGAGNYQGNIQLRGNNSNFTGRIVVTNGLDLVFTNDFNLGLAPANFRSDAVISRGANLRAGTSSYRPSINANRGINNIGGFTVYTGIALNSPITGPGGVTVRSDYGSVLGSSSNDYAGLTQVYTDNPANSYLSLGVDNAMPHGTGKGNLDLKCWGAGTVRFDLNGKNVVINGLTTSGSGSLYNNCVVDNASAGGTVRLTLGDGNATGNNYYGRIINTTGTLNLTKIGTGTQTLSGSCTYTGATTVNGGTLTIAGTNSASSGMAVNNGGTLVVSGFLSNAVPLTLNAGGTLQADLSVNINGVFNSASDVTLTGGTLNIKGKNSGTSATALGSLAVNPAGSTLSLTPNGGSGTALTLGNTWTRSVGGTLLVDVSVAGSTVSSSPTLQNGIIGGYAFVKDGTGTGFATVTGVNLVRYTGATVLDASAAAADLTGTMNYNLDTDRTLTGASTTQTVNSLRLNNASLGLGSKLLVVGSGGIIFSNTTWKGISGGTITAGGSDLVIYAGFVNNEDCHYISSAIVDNGGPVGLTLAGGYRFALQGANTYSGDTVVNGGTLRGGGVIPYGAGKGNLVINAGGYVDLAKSSWQLNGLASSPGNVGGGISSSWGDAGAKYNVTVGNGNATASYPGLIANGGADYYVALVKVGNGTQTLSGINTYSGGTVLSNGVLSVSSTNNIGGANAKVTFAGGTLLINGTTFTSFGVTPLTFTSTGGGLDIADAGNSFTLTNNLGTGTVFTKTGSGTLTLTGTQAGTINTDDPSKISFGSGLGFYNLGVTTNGVLSPAGSGTIGMLAVNNNLTLAGKLLADVTASTNDMVTAGGTITLSGATLEIVNTTLLNRTQKYILMAAGSPVSGSLTELNLPARWKVSTDGNTVLLYYLNPGTMVQFF